MDIMKRMSNAQYIQEAADAVVTTRDFCGSESNAIRMVEDDYGIRFTSEERFEIMSRADGTWRESQIQAGARILTPDQRRKAYRDLE